MKKIYITIILLFSINYVYAFSWDDCIEKYEKARQFSDYTKLKYVYLKSTKSCLIKFKKNLIKNPNPEFTVQAMQNNIDKIDTYIDDLIPNYYYPDNNIEQIPKYISFDAKKPIINKEYDYIKRFKECNGVQAGDKIYTAKHCKLKDAIDINYDLSYIKTSTKTKLQTSKLNLDKKGTFKYYSMSREGLFYNTILEEKNCKFYKAKNIPMGQNTTLDLTDLEKKEEIRSNCVAIPSNSGGGVFQNNKLVGIISKTVFNNNKFLYSVVEPIYPIK